MEPKVEPQKAKAEAYHAWWTLLKLLLLLQIPLGLYNVLLATQLACMTRE